MASNEPVRLDHSTTASKWVSVDRNGEERLSTLARLCIVLIVWCAGWFWDGLRFDDLMPPPDIQSSTVVGYALAAVVIALMHSVGRPVVRGRARLVWSGLVLAFAAAVLIAALLTGYERGWH